jgi:hypothetical protein
MATKGNQDSNRQRVVDATIHLHGAIDATRLVRTNDRMGSPAQREACYGRCP